MKPLAPLLACALVGMSPGAALAQAPVSPAPGPAVKVSGYDRVRVMSQLNYDLDAAAPADAWLLYTDMRGWVGLEAAWERMKIVASTDLAGTDFDEGAVFGFDNPARQRPVQVLLRHLYLDYAVPELGLGATLGRQPVRLGFGIVTAINRDLIRVTEALGDLGPLERSSLALTHVRGAKGNTLWPDHLPAPTAGVTVQPGMAGSVQGATVANDPDGSWHGLDTYVLAYNAAPAGQRLQAFFAQQIDTTQAGMYPSKRYLDVNGEAQLGPWKLGAEGAWLTGVGPTSAATGRRPDLRSYMVYGTASYALEAFDIGLAVGRGGGDNDPTDATNNGFQALFIDEQSLAVTPLFGDDLHGYDGTDAGIARGAGFNNVTFVQPSVNWRLAPGVVANLGYTYHLATVPQKVGAGVLGQISSAAGEMTTDIGSEVDARLTWRLGATTLYGVASTFVPGAIYARSGAGNAASKLELGTELRF